MPLTSFFNNHKQNRSATALPTANNASSSSLPSPEYQAYSPDDALHQHPQLHLQHHQQQLQLQHHQQQTQHHQQQTQHHQQLLQAHQQAQQQAQQHQQSRGPARHSSLSGTPAGPQYLSSSSPEPPAAYAASGLTRQGSGAAESQQTLLADSTIADNLSYSSTSSTVYAGSTNDGPAAAIPAKSTLRKPVLTKDPPTSSSSSSGISGLFHRHHSKHDQSSDGAPSLSSTASAIGRKLSTRKSNPPTPQQSPNIPQQIDEDGHTDRYAQGARSPRPQSLLPPGRDHAESLRVLKRSDTDAPAYSQTQQQRPPSLVQTSNSPLQPQPYYNIATGQYGASPSVTHHPEQQQQQQTQSPSISNPSRGDHQPPPQAQYPGLKPQQQSPQQQQPPQIQQPAGAAYTRSSSDLSALLITTTAIAVPGSLNTGGLVPGQTSNNPPVSPGASIHTVDTMPGGNNPAPSGPQQTPAGADRSSTPTGKLDVGNGGGSGMTPSQVQALMTEFDTLQSKYRKVKNLYFERAAEIERLQNTMANQRMSQSRTSLDDNQYSSRFERLDGAIKNLAFEIRQSWKVIPGWLQPVVNPGAEVKGGREMTVVGRAAISRWVVDEILDRFFHPGLDPATSANLKGIENGIRRNSPQPQSIEEDDNLSAKVCAWRMSTVDGIKPLIESVQGKDNSQKLKEFLEEKLKASLAMHLNEPLPAGLDGGVNTIIDIAVGLLEHLPIESRDVRVWYPLPGEKFDSVFMRSETGLQPLVNAPGADSSASGKTEITVDGKPIAQVDKPGAVPPPPPKDDPGLHPSNSVKSADTGKKQSVLKGIRGKLAGAAGGSGAGQPPAQPVVSAPQQPPPQQSQPNPSQTSLAESPAVGKLEGGLPHTTQQAGPGLEKVRVAGFMAVEVRGKSILMKAPVWT
ncbi:hypothetical protein Dda_2243 [Drechslerella dactyloides]|uniref:S-adenosylmethionine-dependent methyltransferase-like protein n=1 Tax=Drechslerella dactyloides TaxID=74499 RepID=A0AAD6J4Z9_DREDA|nr:hypothetical protein Dda_2243 [Drechslerella dactyloides]